MDKIIVTISGILGVIFTYWFFLMKKEKIIKVNDSADSTDSTSSPQASSLQVDIIVEGGYSPDVISIPKGKTTKLNFLRKDPSSCLEEVVLGDFKIRKQLPLNQRVTIELTPQQAGEFKYSCGMNMYHGKIIVR
jgi:plastocyanin domain-containing protein